MSSNRLQLTITECDVADGTCEEIKELYSFLPMVSQEESLHYKYSIDV